MTKRSWLFPASLLTLAACRGEDKTPSAVSDLDEARAPFALQVVPTVRVGAAELVVRVVNSYGVAVPAGAVTMSYAAPGGSSTELVVEAGPTGTARAQVEAAPGPVQIEASSVEGATLEGVATGESWVLAQPLPLPIAPALGLLPLEPGAEPDFAAPGTNGVVVAIDDQLWWRPADPADLPYLLADLPYDVAGLQAAHIDDDGLLDLLVWSGDIAAVLRGQRDGGYTWKNGWRSTFGAVVGATVSDVNSDQIADVSVGVSGEDKGQIELLLGDGGWGFEAMEPLIVNGEFYSLAVTDEGFDGSPDASVISVASSTVRRYTYAEKGWQGAPTSELAGYEAAAGSTLLPSTDLDGDFDQEVIMVGSPAANTQDLVFYVLGDDSGSTSVSYELPWGRFYAALADMNGDGLLDMVGLDDGLLHVVRWIDEQFTDETNGDMGVAGPIAVADWNNDQVNDLAVATDAVAFHDGKRDEGGTWSPDRGGWITHARGLIGDIVVEDLTGDGRADVMGFTIDGPDLVVATYTAGEAVDGVPTFNFADSIQLAEGALPLGIVRCAPNTYALVQEGDGTLRLHRLGVSLAGVLSEPSAPVAVDGELLACSAIPGDPKAVVVAQTSGFATTYGAGLGGASSTNIEAINAVGLADTDGDGAAEVVGCIGEGCSVAVVPMIGGDAVVRAEDTTYVTIGGESIPRQGGGQLGVADLDNDGQLDVLGWDAESGRLSLLRAAGAQLAPTAGYHLGYGLLGRPAAGDIDGDGVKELVFVNDAGEIAHAPLSSTR